MVFMARHWYPLAESGDAFLNSAPFRYAHSVETTASAERIWEALTGEALVRWVPVFTGLRWDSSRPFGVGTVREVTLLGVFTARERFLPLGRRTQRCIFGVVEASLPGLRRGAEDWIVEPTPAGSRLTWTMAIEVRPLMTPLAWDGGPVIGLVQRRTLRVIRVHVGD